MISNKLKKLLNEEKQKTFKTNLGYIDFKYVDKDYRYEFEDEDSEFWNKANKWISIEEIRVNQKFHGNGKILIKEFIDSLEDNTGVVLNAVPMDSDVSFRQLQNWYINLGFKEIKKGNISLYYIKK